MGPPGANRKQNTDAMANLFNWTPISTGDLLQREVVRKTKLGESIKADLDSHCLVNDDAVI